MIAIFTDDTLQHLIGIQTAIATQNFSALEHHAHHIKGASANVGLKTMEAIAAELEYQARHHDIEGAPYCLISLQNTLQEVKLFSGKTKPEAKNQKLVSN
ncbi:MAG: Hpt domain-containing protein [Leptolyngbyaceae cyanobacterium SL_5_14]|nr:Hpt domain-containing protein [Leptolyngbyaceae cyanobacterium SL_5_14]